MIFCESPSSHGQRGLELDCKNNLATLYMNEGNLTEAEIIFQDLYDIHRVDGEKTESTLLALNSLGEAIRRQGRTNEAMEILKNVLDTSKSELGDRHVLTRAARANMTCAYGDAGRLDDARILVLHGVLLGEFPDAAHVLTGGTLEEANAILERQRYRTI
jgi:tetratricopeptide (TPR) repeat protein